MRVEREPGDERDLCRIRGRAAQKQITDPNDGRWDFVSFVRLVMLIP